MKVSSPVGDFPFEPKRLEVTASGVVVHGEMGAWPATVRIDLADLPALVRLIPAPVRLGLVLAGGWAGLRLLRHR